MQNFFGDGSRYNVAIQYATQTIQDGTGRVVELARDFVGESPFVLAYGDILVDPVNYKGVVNLPDDAEAILTVTRGEDVSKGGAVFVNEQMELLDIREKHRRMKSLGKFFLCCQKEGLPGTSLSEDLLRDELLP